MGAEVFLHNIEAYDASSAFTTLVRNAEDEYGDRSYNGTISTCSMGRVRILSNTWSESVEEKAMKIVEDEDYGHKWTASVLDLGVVGYDVITTTKTAPTIKKKAVYKTQYAVMCIPPSYPIQEKFEKGFDSKKDADAYAIKLALEHQENEYFVAKRPVNTNNGDDVVSKIKVSVVRKEKKPRSTPKNGVVRPVHKYIFYGWASC